MKNNIELVSNSLLPGYTLWKQEKNWGDCSEYPLPPCWCPDTNRISRVLPKEQALCPLDSLWTMNVSYCTCSQSLSPATVLPMALHWKVANWPALTSTFWIRRKWGVLAAGRQRRKDVESGGLNPFGSFQICLQFRAFPFCLPLKKRMPLLLRALKISLRL